MKSTLRWLAAVLLAAGNLLPAAQAQSEATRSVFDQAPPRAIVLDEHGNGRFVNEKAGNTVNATIACGTHGDCPAGSYNVGFTNSTCTSNISFPYNAFYCESVGAQEYTTCKKTCASGYFLESLPVVNSLGSASCKNTTVSGDNYGAHCISAGNPGGNFRICNAGASCPGGYSQSAPFFDNACCANAGGCTGNNAIRCTGSGGDASISASAPTVVIPQGNSNGQVTINWNAPGHSSVVVWISINGAAETNWIGSGSTGSGVWPYLAPNTTTVFSLKPNGSNTVLAQVTVQATAGAAPTISASPNPVIVPAGATGKTTISWNAPGHPRIYLTIVNTSNGAISNWHGDNGSGSKEWPFLQAGDILVFRLHPDGQSTVLASVEVRAELAGTPSIVASPTNVIIAPGQSAGNSTISWNAPGYSNVGISVLGSDGIAQTWTSGGSSGSQVWPYVGINTTQIFRLHPYGSSSVLATATVTGQASASVTVDASPREVVIPIGSSNGTTTVSWNAPGVPSTVLWVSVNGAPKTNMSGGGSSGSAQAPWIVAGNQYRFSLTRDGDPTELGFVVVTARSAGGKL